MIKSMTGYGSAELTAVGKKVSVEIKSVNHRYIDINIRAPRTYGYIEEAIRTALSEYMNRGKVDVYVNIEDISGEDTKILINKAVAKGYYDALAEIRDQFEIEDKINLATLSRFSDIFKVEKAEDDNEEILKVVSEVAKEAGKAFAAMREAEGERLYADIMYHTDEIEKMVLRIEEYAPSIVSEYKARLENRMKEILENVPVDENRLMNEVAIFSDRVNVNEEIIRLKSHIVHMRKLLSLSEPVGRKIDFLIQEMNRETNTIGSKTNDLTVAEIVIDIKAGIEKMREQVQNVE